jgi:hypothetical protein
MLKTINIQINKIIGATKISVRLEDPIVEVEQYAFFKNRLKDYKLYINPEYDFKSELHYNRSSKLLSIEINIIIPDKSISKNTAESNDLHIEPINTFHLFYDVQNEIYERKHRNLD